VSDRRRPEDPYRRALVRARAEAGKLSRQSVLAIHDELYRYAQVVAARIRAINPGVSRAAQDRAIRAATAAIWEAAQKLEKSLAGSIGNYQASSYTVIRGIWLETAERSIAAARKYGVVVAAMQAPPITVATAYELLGGAAQTWKTALPQYVRFGARELNAIVRGSVLQGVSPDVLARKLRPYVQGIDEFSVVAQGIPGLNVADLRPLVRQALHDPRARTALNASRTMRHNSERIAFSEVFNARRTAEVLHYASDPAVWAVQWRLAPNRGALVGSCECDAFALSDFFGLGPGIYPVDQVPFAPHPWCRCEQVPLIRPFAEFNEPKPMPKRQLSGARARLPKGVTRQEAARIREEVDRLISESSPAHAGLRKLARQSVASVTPGGAS